MKRTAKIVAFVAALLALLLAGAYVLIETGEVVVLRAAPRDGHALLARLWVVDHDARPWISTTDPSKTHWVPWLRAHSTVELERGGVASCRRAVFVDDPALRRRLNALHATKYGIARWGSELIRLVASAERDVERRVWIRLDPCDGGLEGKSDAGGEPIPSA